MTEKTSHKSTVFKCVVWWSHCVKHIVLVCRAASSCKGWVGVCSTENMGGQQNYKPGSKGRGEEKWIWEGWSAPVSKGLNTTLQWCSSMKKKSKRGWKVAGKEMPSLCVLHLVRGRRKHGRCQCDQTKRRMSVWSSLLCLVFFSDGSCCSLILPINRV